ALTARLFDDVPPDRMADAERTVREAAANMPAEVRARIETTKNLSDEDRESIMQSLRKALTGFQLPPELESEAGEAHDER
ncbi:MAG: F0F1 ATP synthase subunit alpha, partial [Nitrosospira sp.]